jgi:hypothetical protein
VVANLPQLPIPPPEPPVVTLPVSVPSIPVPSISAGSPADPAGSSSAAAAGSLADRILGEVPQAAPTPEGATVRGDAPTSGSGHAERGPGEPFAQAARAVTTDVQERQAGVDLRRIVRQFGGCISALPTTERHVLVLRANLGASLPRSRARVAQILGISVANVRSVEQQALGDLRHAGRSEFCAAGGGLDAPAAFVSFAEIRPQSVGAAPSQPATRLRRRLRAVASAALRGATAHANAASPAAERPRPPGATAGAWLPRWLGLGLVGLIALMFTAFVAFQFWDVNGGRRRWQYRRSLRRSVGPPPAPFVPDRTAMPRRQPGDQPPRHHPYPPRRSRRPLRERRPGA